MQTYTWVHAYDCRFGTELLDSDLQLRVVRVDVGMAVQRWKACRATCLRVFPAFQTRPGGQTVNTQPCVCELGCGVLHAALRLAAYRHASARLDCLSFKSSSAACAVALCVLNVVALLIVASCWVVLQHMVAEHVQYRMGGRSATQ